MTERATVVAHSGGNWRKWYMSFRTGWGYVVALIVIIAGWTVWNLPSWPLQFDPFPFIALNLLLSIEAAFAMPVLLMEQFRHEAEDRALLRAGLAEDRDIARLVKRVLGHLEDEEKEE